MDYSKKENSLLNRINKRIIKLNADLERMEDTESKAKHFIEQEKALHEIRSIIREEKAVDKTKEKAEEASEKAVDKLIKEQDKAVTHIVKKIDDLDKNLANLDDDDSKVKSYLEQKKVVKDIKDILKEFE
ncbi:hypothetical protein [Ligilactobacillus cholophilus]|uniref:hypothetical protein n=1 Tax=Ligilactobacillus cholophilus TaxID=3050131 RepID=UPI0025B06E1B|nr:hypothetical protein [Ligilactobacillus cholophilus]